MALRWLQSMFARDTKQLNIYREYCKATAISSEERLHENPYFKKYAHKISEIHRTPSEEFKSKQNEEFKISKSVPKSSKESDISKEKNIPRFSGQKNLNQIMKLETLEDKSASEIETIWKTYHQSKDALFAVIPKETYKNLFERLAKYPVFLFPLPRSEGYEFIMLQFQEHSCYFTSLINYQAYKENAPACLTITYFTELLESKEIILMKGEYDDKAITIQEAQCLANQLQLYYGGKDEKKEKLLWTFNKQPETFRHMDLVSNFEYSLGK